jgi:hypothetical protein
MSRKRNDGHSGKARDYGGNSTQGLSRHRGSGKNQINRVQREILAKERDRENDERSAARRRRTEWFDSVADLLRKQ